MKDVYGGIEHCVIRQRYVCYGCSTIPGIYSSKQIEFEGVAKRRGFFANSHKSLATCAITSAQRACREHQLHQVWVVCALEEEHVQQYHQIYTVFFFLIHLPNYHYKIFKDDPLMINVIFYRFTSKQVLPGLRCLFSLVVILA